MATNYFWDEIEDNVVEEYDDAGNTIVSYTTEPTLYGSVLSQDRGGEVRHYHFDGQGNTTELTDASGSVADTRRYSAFGEVRESTGTTVFSYQCGGRWGYHTTGDESLLTIRRRLFMTSRARWLSLDPVLNSASFSRYVFVHNRPVQQIDPSGLAPPVIWTWDPPPFDPTADLVFPEIPLAEFPSDDAIRRCRRKFDFPKKWLNELPCGKMVWHPSFCPTCTCAKSFDGKPDISRCKSLVDRLKQELLQSIPPACRDRVQLMKFTCEAVCAGVKDFAVTCSDIQNNRLTLGMCLPSEKPICSIKALLEHEALHAREIIDSFCSGNPLDSTSDQELRAYSENCTLEADQQCFRGAAWHNYVEKCMKDGVAASVTAGPAFDCSKYLR